MLEQTLPELMKQNQNRHHFTRYIFDDRCLYRTVQGVSSNS